MNKIPNFDAYFLDLDGTSLDDSFLHRDNGYFHGFSKKNMNLIIKENIKTPITISTGRDKHYVQKILPKLGIKYGICQNGSIIIDNKGNILKEIHIDKNIAYSLIQFVDKNKLGLKINDDKGFYGGGFLLSLISKLVKQKKISNKINYEHKKYNKISIFGKSKIAMNRILQDILKMCYPISAVTSSNGLIIEVTDIKATKGTAALWVCKKLNIDPKKSVHVGDTMNDIPAFMVLGAGIAMENSSREVKQFATYITSHYKKDGLKNVFLKNMSINKDKISTR